ncbi:hypothetical protein [Kitasatospora sp. NPDC088779]|uniref:terpene synthase family protein n=1 Tax=Kitasatospora sp. NPDC088779 TaxID=3154964 RepID=UPI003442A09C
MDGFSWLTGVEVPGGFRATWEEGAHIQVSVIAGRLTVRRSSRSDPNGSLLIDDFDLAGRPGQIAMPATFKLGFAAGTGDATAAHRIRNLSVALPANMPLVCPDAEHAALMGTVGAYGTAATTPCATGLTARTLARYMAWGFALDDESDRAGTSEDNLHQTIRRVTRLVQVMETPDAHTPDDDLWVRAWADIAQDLHTIAQPSALRRAIDGFRSYALGVVHEASLQRTATLPSLDEYLAFRYASGAGAAVAAMVEIATGVDIPAHEIDSPAAIAATQTAVTIALLDNELLSRHKETERGEYDCSLIRVLQNEDPPPHPPGSRRHGQRPAQPHPGHLPQTPRHPPPGRQPPTAHLPRSPRPPHRRRHHVDRHLPPLHQRHLSDRRTPTVRHRHRPAPPTAPSDEHRTLEPLHRITPNGTARAADWLGVPGGDPCGQTGTRSSACSSEPGRRRELRPSRDQRPHGDLPDREDGEFWALALIL